MKRLAVPPLFLMTLLLLVLPLALTGCPNQNDDDDDDDAQEPATLSGAFLNPHYNLDRPREKLEALVKRMAEDGVDTLILPWTSHLGRSIYPSEIYIRELRIAADDFVGALLDAAQDNGMDVILGLHSARPVRDAHIDPLGPELERSQDAVDDLLLHYGTHPALAGFHLNYEFLDPADAMNTALLAGIASHIHTVAPGMIVSIIIKYPGYPQVDFMAYFLEISNDFAIEDVDDSACLDAWAFTWAYACKDAGLDVVMVRDQVGDLKNSVDRAARDISAFAQHAEKARAAFAIWPVVDLFSSLLTDHRVLPRHPAGDPDRIREQIESASRFGDAVIGYTYDYLLTDDAPWLLNAPSEPEEDDVLLEKAVWVDEHLRSCCFRDDQLVTVMNGGLRADHPDNMWQEDACWLTGLYASAQSYRYAVTRETEAREYARSAWRALHTMANVTPLTGEVVRNYATYLVNQLTPVQPDWDTIKRWHKHPDREIYWVGDVSVDQLSGYMHGLATYYDLVADQSEREIIRQDVRNIMTLILDNDLRAKEFNGLNTTYGNLRSAPELCLDLLRIAHHITGDQKFLDAYWWVVSDERMDLRVIVFHYVMHYLARKYGGQHFLDSGLDHLLIYEDDPDLFHTLQWALEWVFIGSHAFGNAAQDLTHQTHNPASNGGLRALGEMLAFDPRNLDNGYWCAHVNHIYPEDVYVPIEERPAQEWMWTYAPEGTIAPRGDCGYQYTGVGFLLTYWKARYMGLAR